MAFNARLDIAYSYIETPPKTAFIRAVFVDLLGQYVGDLISPGNRILQDVTGIGFPQDTLVYEVTENMGSDDGGTTYTLKGNWVLDGDPIDLQSGYTTIVGDADASGIVDIPEPLSQQMDVVATNRLRNYVARLAKPSTTSGVTVVSDNFTGDINGINDTFQTEFNFIPGSVKFYYNGMRMREGATLDFVTIGSNVVKTNFLPQAGDALVIEYSK